VLTAEREFAQDSGYPGIPCSWVRVTSVSDDWPVVNIFPAGIDRNPWMNMQVTAYDEMQRKPVVLVKVSYAGSSPAYWSAIDPQSSLAYRVKPWRTWEQAAAKGTAGPLPKLAP
jgi:hypothetical protein